MRAAPSTTLLFALVGGSTGFTTIPSATALGKGSGSNVGRGGGAAQTAPHSQSRSSSTSSSNGGASARSLKALNPTAHVAAGMTALRRTRGGGWTAGSSGAPGSVCMMSTSADGGSEGAAGAATATLSKDKGETAAASSNSSKTNGSGGGSSTGGAAGGADGDDDEEYTLENLPPAPPCGPLDRDYVIDSAADAEKARKEREEPPLTPELAANPLLNIKGLPKFVSIEASSVVPAMEHLLDITEKRFAELEARLLDPYTSSSWGQKRMLYDYEGVIDELEKVKDPLFRAWGIVHHLKGVQDSKELREAFDLINPKVIKLSQRLGQSKPVYEAAQFLLRPASVRTLSEVQIRVVEDMVRGMALEGVGLEGETKERFNALNLELAELSNKFTNNVLDSTKAFSHTLTTKEQVEGLPASVLEMAAQEARTAGEEAATAEDGPWRITLAAPLYFPLMQHLKDRNIREMFYRKYLARASGNPEEEGSSSNEANIVRILELRSEKAKILGFETYAEQSLSVKMAGSVQDVTDLSEKLREKSLPAAKRELKETEEYARAHGFDEDKFELWDTSFWSERRKEELFAFKEEDLRPYFPLPAVRDGMFDLARRLFGVQIEEVEASAEAAGAEGVEVWDKDVSFYKVYEETEGGEKGAHVASFYLDPYVRPENKRGGAWMADCQGRSKVLDRIPVAYLTCNGSPPVAGTDGAKGKPSLMSFSEVSTLFHEFGHGLQHMLTRVDDANAAGINNIEWDAVELPSQFMENWCYHQPTVNKFARHYETGEPLPQDLFDKLQAQRTYMAGSFMLRQLYFGVLDMGLHGGYDPKGDKTPFELQREIASRYTVMPPLEEDRFLCSFAHIFAGGYAAGYYSYKWAEVMSADAFEAFEEAGLEKEEEIKKVGRHFRETVLAKGGGRHPRDVYQDFRGRDAKPDALLRHAGL